MIEIDYDGVVSYLLTEDEFDKSPKGYVVLDPMVNIPVAYLPEEALIYFVRHGRRNWNANPIAGFFYCTPDNLSDIADSYIIHGRGKRVL